MADDYRNTKYCPTLSELPEKKEKIKQAILKEHPQAKDFYPYLSKNSLGFKQQFVETYNGKCSYCGVPIGIIGWKQLEVDHFIPKGSSRFTTKAQAGNIENLVLACYDCNRSKSNFELGDEDCHKIHPDGSDICKSFIRDENYYIRISEGRSTDESVIRFYNKIGLDKQIHRLDYLLMNMCGLRDLLKDNPSAYVKLNEAIELMQQKRR